MKLMYNIREIFDQAINSEKSIITKMPNGCNVVYKGVKIQMFPDRIEILDMSRGGDYYKVVSQDIYSLFYKNGWILGCLKLSIINCIYKLKLIESKIKTEVNTRKNDKHIKNLKNKRELALCKHAELQLKLKSILN